MRRRGLAVGVGVVLAACGAGASSTPAPVRHTPTPHPQVRTVRPTPPPPPPPPPTSPAPAIIQVENLGVARPQAGLNGADVVYEYETEGGISRFSLIYFHPPPTEVGPVRSARIATVQLVQIWGATLLYSGASIFVDGLLNAAHVRHFTEDAPFTYRVRARYVPHNLYTGPGQVAAMFGAVGPLTVPWVLWPRTTPAAPPPPGGEAAAQFTVPVSNYEVPTFTYDPSRGFYIRTEPGTGTMTDAATGAPWGIPSVVVLHVPVAVAPEVEDVSGVHGLSHTLAGRGAAEFFTGGVEYHGSYNQGPSGPPQLLLASGAPAPIATGQVLIMLVR